MDLSSLSHVMNLLVSAVKSFHGFYFFFYCQHLQFFSYEISNVFVTGTFLC